MAEANKMPSAEEVAAAIRSGDLDLSGTDLRGADLTDADLRGAKGLPSKRTLSERERMFRAFGNLATALTAAVVLSLLGALILGFAEGCAAVR